MTDDKRERNKEGVRKQNKNFSKLSSCLTKISLQKNLYVTSVNVIYIYLQRTFFLIFSSFMAILYIVGPTFLLAYREHHINTLLLHRFNSTFLLSLMFFRLYVFHRTIRTSNFSSQQQLSQENLQQNYKLINLLCPSSSK